MIRHVLVALLLLLPTTAFAQKKARPKPERPEPTVADYAYGQDSERQKFDFWQAKSDKPTPLVLLIHGGGWMDGDKTRLWHRRPSSRFWMLAFQWPRSTIASSRRPWSRTSSRR